MADESRTVPVTDQPGGRVIGEATLHPDGTFTARITDPERFRELTGDSEVVSFRFSMPDDRRTP